MREVLVVGFVEKGPFYGIMAGYSGLKNPSPRGTIDAEISLRMWE